MGIRSNNALIVKASHSVPASVAQAFDLAFCGKFAEGNLWVWETNISPLWARHGVEDLREEVTIFGWLMTLPREDFKLVRAGAELGTLGAWDVHSFRCLSAQYREVLEQYDQQVMEATPDPAGRLWHKGAPPALGWYLANRTRTGLAWRFWNGKNWSVRGVRGLMPDEAAEFAKLPECASLEQQLWWSDYWPEGLVLNRSYPPPEVDPSAVPVPLAQQIAGALNRARRELSAVINQAVAGLGEVSICESHADGTWEVTVDSHGVRLGGYAAESQPPGTGLSGLPIENLVSLAENALTRLRPTCRRA